MPALDRLIAAQVRDTIIAAGLVSPDPSPVAIDANVVAISFMPVFSAEDVEDLIIRVAPVTRQTEYASRATRTGIYTIQVGFFQAVEPDSTHFLGLVDLVASIDDLLSTASTNPSASVTLYGKWESSACRLFDVDQLNEHRIFDSRLTLSYRAYS